MRLIIEINITIETTTTIIIVTAVMKGETNETNTAEDIISTTTVGTIESSVKIPIKKITQREGACFNG